MRDEFQERMRQFMGYGLRLFSVRGIEVRAHLTLIILLLWMLVQKNAPAGVQPGTIERLLAMAVNFGVLFGSILLHELGHCYGAELMGGRARSILLWPLGGLATVEGAEESPYKEFVVTILGPAVSLVLAVVGWIALKVFPVSLASGMFGFLLWDFVFMLWAINWRLFVFNMCVPIFPMDCARLIRSSLSMWLPANRVTYYLMFVGALVGSMLAFVGFFKGNIFLVLIGLFGIQNCMQTLQYLEYSDVYSDPFSGMHRFHDLRNALLAKIGLRRGPSAVIREVRPRGAKPAPGAKMTERELLEMQLRRCVEDENFEEAARIRDRLKTLGDQPSGRR